MVLEPSGFHYPNRFARYLLLAVESVMGRGGMEGLVQIAGMNPGQLPPDNLKRQFDFAHVAALNLALEEMYGARGGRGMALRIGRVWFSDGLRTFGLLAGLAHPDFQVLPLSQRVEIGLRALNRVFETYSDQQTGLHQDAQRYYFTVENSPIAWGRRTEKPTCHMLAGALQGCLHYASNGYEYHVFEQECHATGSSHCVFAINRNPIGQVGSLAGE